MLLSSLLSLLFVSSTISASLSGRTFSPRQTVSGNNGLQNVVTWDQYSLKINGERLLIWSGEVHPYRMPVPSMYLDIFQKIKAMGFNAVSFYVFWGMIEAKRGEISFDTHRDLQPFFDAAMEAGVYLIARPGPYINAETSGGGFPGWGAHTPGLWRTMNETYIDAYRGYIAAIGAKIAANQITNGGPVILVQVENEYSGFQPPLTEDFTYESELLKSFRAAGITVPTTTNDAWPGSHFLGVDLYGYDSYPNGFDCSHPNTWGADAVPQYFYGAHLDINPNDPNAVYEFQGGAFDGWGGSGYDTCAILTGPNFERVFYKNQFAMSTTVLNLYMTYGGTNWGGIAHPGVYTSYDYGSAIAEDRTLREKYYELKLQANFMMRSPAFLTTRPMNLFNNIGSFTGNQALVTTQTLDVVGNRTGFYFVRQNDTSTDTVQNYTINLPTSAGNLTVPLLGGMLTLNGKDSKIHVVDYMAGNTNVLYSTGEIATWATIDGRDVLVLYGDSGEVHETAFVFDGAALEASVVSGSSNLKTKTIDKHTLVIQYHTTGQTIVQIGSQLLLFIVDRANAYQFWTLYPPSNGPFAAFSHSNPVIVKGGYLLRSASMTGNTLDIRGDLNETTSFEIIAPRCHTQSIIFNGHPLRLTATKYGTLTARKSPVIPDAALPDLSKAAWRSADSLPEIKAMYSDALWTVANHTTSVNPIGVTSPVVLYAGDYGFHVGNILWRAHFSATGLETGLNMELWGGAAFGYSVWLDSTFIGSWVGNAVTSGFAGSFKFLSKLSRDSAHIITILQDHMGLEEDWTAGSDQFKIPRGIMNYTFDGSPNTKVSVWKVSGNLGGENAVDKIRGPLNEGGLFAERQGWHLPGFDDSHWVASSPKTGISSAGVAFYRTTFDLNIPSSVDYPIAFVISNSTINTHFRAQLYVNGYQFGKYLNAIGPQTSFPIPQGILNYNGTNTLALSLWATDVGGASIDSVKLHFTSRLESSMKPIINAPQPAWIPRLDAY